MFISDSIFSPKSKLKNNAHSDLSQPIDKNWNMIIWKEIEIKWKLFLLTQKQTL